MQPAKPTSNPHQERPLRSMAPNGLSRVVRPSAMMQRKPGRWIPFHAGTSTTRFAYALVLPAVLLLAGLVAYPFSVCDLCVVYQSRGRECRPMDWPRQFSLPRPVVGIHERNL